MAEKKTDVELRMATLSKPRQQLVKLAAKGTPVGQMARILGVTDGAISKALAEPKVIELVNDLRFESETRTATQDEKLELIQGKLIDKLEESIDNIWKPNELIAALEKISKIPRRSVGETPNQTTVQTTVVQVSLPVAAKQFLVQRNANNQVVKAGEQTLVTMQSQEVARRFSPKETPALEVFPTQETTNPTEPEPRAELIRAADVESSLGATVVEVK